MPATKPGDIRTAMAALSLDGPAQDETAILLPTTHDGGWCCAVIDAGGLVGQRLGAQYAPLAAAGELRLLACIANCGPFDWLQHSHDKIG